MLRNFLNYFKNRELYRFQRRWRKVNLDNDTRPANIFDVDKVEVGKYSYGPLFVVNDTDSKLKIGTFCSIAAESVFLLGLDHPTNHISTYPFKVKMAGESAEAVSKGDIIIDDDVWIGYRAMILSGVHIGQGAIIAAGAVVTHDVPPYAIVGGIPAKVIKYRFSEKIIDDLLKVDYSKLDKKRVLEHLNDMYKPIQKKSDYQWLLDDLKEVKHTNNLFYTE